MNKQLILLLLIVLMVMPMSAVNAEKQISREKLLEETLMLRYLSTLTDAVDSQFMCENITDIRRIDRSNRKHKLSIEVVTFEGPHNPPNDLIKMTIVDTPAGGTDVKDLDRKKNLSPEKVRALCRR